MKLKYHSDSMLGWITLSNPPYNNLAHPVFADYLELREFLADSNLKAIIIKGEGRHFCGGADLENLKTQIKNPEEFSRSMKEGKSLLEAITFATIPVLAMVRGCCLGAGLEIALACHFRFASENAIFGFPETERGMIPGFGGTAFIQGIMPRQSVVELILSGRMIRGPEALSLGLVDRVMPTSGLETAVTEFLQTLTAERPAGLIRAVMESIHNGRLFPVEEALRRETELFCKVACDELPELST